jgi:chromosome segregation ATPase
MESLNQIQMLKQQISVYADDFAKERSNREIVQADRDALKERVKEYEKEMAVLNEQVYMIFFS